MKRAFAAILLCTMAAGAQSQNLWQRFVGWLTEGSTVDTAYIYQRPARLQFTLDGSLQHVDVSLTADYLKTCVSTDEFGQVVEEEQVQARAASQISENYNGGLGLGVGYGKLGLAWGFDVGPRNAEGSSALKLGYQGHKWGIALNGYAARKYTDNTVTVGTDTSRWYSHSESTSLVPCEIGKLSVDAYWVIGRSRFAYTSAYKCDMVQRRSAGSVVICAQLLLNAASCGSGDELFSASGFTAYGGLQTSVGAGYSHNIVFLHRDPTGPRDKGLRNLTLNLTLMPVLSTTNALDAVRADGSRVRIQCIATPNATFGTALGYSVGRWFFTLGYAHNFAYFHSSGSLNTDDLAARGISNVSASGLFQDWRLSVMAAVNL